jgi:hypothetical protein
MNQADRTDSKGHELCNVVFNKDMMVKVSELFSFMKLNKFRRLCNETVNWGSREIVAGTVVNTTVPMCNFKHLQMQPLWEGAI